MDINQLRHSSSNHVLTIGNIQSPYIENPEKNKVSYGVMLPPLGGMNSLFLNIIQNFRNHHCISEGAILAPRNDIQGFIS